MVSNTATDNLFEEQEEDDQRSCCKCGSKFTGTKKEKSSSYPIWYKAKNRQELGMTPLGQAQLWWCRPCYDKNRRLEHEEQNILENLSDSEIAEHQCAICASTESNSWQQNGHGGWLCQTCFDRKTTGLNDIDSRICCKCQSSTTQMHKSINPDGSILSYPHWYRAKNKDEPGAVESGQHQLWWCRSCYHKFFSPKWKKHKPTSEEKTIAQESPRHLVRADIQEMIRIEKRYNTKELLKQYNQKTYSQIRNDVESGILNIDEGWYLLKYSEILEELKRRKAELA